MWVQIKTVVYLACCIAEDEVNQKRGVVGLFYFNRNIHTVRRVLLRNSRMMDWMPIKVVGAHVCYNDPKLRILNALFMLEIGRERRVRLRTHEGTIERTGKNCVCSFLFDL
jgi:hypothetical protein